MKLIYVSNTMNIEDLKTEPTRYASSKISRFHIKTKPRCIHEFLSVSNITYIDIKETPDYSRLWDDMMNKHTFAYNFKYLGSKKIYNEYKDFNIKIAKEINEIVEDYDVVILKTSSLYLLPKLVKCKVVVTSIMFDECFIERVPHYEDIIENLLVANKCFISLNAKESFKKYCYINPKFEKKYIEEKSFYISDYVDKDAVLNILYMYLKYGNEHAEISTKSIEPEPKNKDVINKTIKKEKRLQENADKNKNSNMNVNLGIRENSRGNTEKWEKLLKYMLEREKNKSNVVILTNIQFLHIESYIKNNPESDIRYIRESIEIDEEQSRMTQYLKKVYGCNIDIIDEYDTYYMVLEMLFCDIFIGDKYIELAKILRKPYLPDCYDPLVLETQIKKKLQETPRPERVFSEEEYLTSLLGRSGYIVKSTMDKDIDHKINKLLDVIYKKETHGEISDICSNEAGSECEKESDGDTQTVGQDSILDNVFKYYGISKKRIIVDKNNKYDACGIPCVADETKIQFESIFESPSGNIMNVNEQITNMVINTNLPTTEKTSCSSVSSISNKKTYRKSDGNKNISNSVQEKDEGQEDSSSSELSNEKNILQKKSDFSYKNIDKRNIKKKNCFEKKMNETIKTGTCEKQKDDVEKQKVGISDILTSSNKMDECANPECAKDNRCDHEKCNMDNKCISNEDRNLDEKTKIEQKDSNKRSRNCPQVPRHVEKMSKDTLINHLKKRNSRKLLLDYDGTLSKMYPRPEQAFPRKELIDLIGRLQKKCDVVLCTGRSQEVCDNWFPDTIDIYAEHGATMRKNGKWKNLVNDLDMSICIEILEYYNKVTPKTILEKKKYGYAFHYKEFPDFDPENLVKLLRKATYGTEIKITLGKFVIEICSATKSLASERENPDVCAGDDLTDENMFRVSRGLNIKVGDLETLADFHVGSVEEFLSHLDVLANTNFK